MPDLPRLPSAASGAAALGSTGDDEPRCFVICLFLPVHYQCITKSVQPSQTARLGLRGGRGSTRPQVRARMSAPEPCHAGPPPIRARRWRCCRRSMAFRDGEARPPLAEQVPWPPEPLVSQPRHSLPKAVVSAASPLGDTCLEKGPIAPGSASPSALPGYLRVPESDNFVPGEATTCFPYPASRSRFALLQRLAKGMNNKVVLAQEMINNRRSSHKSAIPRCRALAPWEVGYCIAGARSWIEVRSQVREPVVDLAPPKTEMAVTLTSLLFELA